ncbi:MAG: MASE3 domain-containing protein [Bacillota bacterium]
MQPLFCLKHNSGKVTCFILFFLLIFILSFINYLLFHTIIELVRILIAFGITAIAFHLNYMARNDDLLSLFGIAYFFIAIFDLLHTLAYQGMGVFTGNTANLATQLWITARYMESSAFFLATLYMYRTVNTAKIIALYTVASSFLLFSVFSGLFPICYDPITGLTPFKIISEYLISIIFIVSGILIYKHKSQLNTNLSRYLLLACITTFIAELSFTFYISVYGISNMIGHLFKLISYIYIYKALIKVKLEEPYEQLQLLSEKLRQEILEKNKALEIKSKTEHELQKISRLQSIGNLASGIAHDFNNILTIIMGNASLAKRYITVDKKIYDRLLEIEEASNQAKDLARQLLTYSKGGAPIKEVVDIGNLTRESLSFVMSGSNIKSEFLSPAEDIYVDVDSGQFKQVINNLVINSIQAMPDGGKIYVSFDTLFIDSKSGIPLKEGRYVQIAIRDEGVGMTKEQTEQIFDPFFTTKNDGHGLGLTTVYSILEKHDGYITLDSQLGEGTVFYIYLPISTEKIKNHNTKANTSILAKTFIGKILVMDDEELIRKSLGNMLIYLGYQVSYAKNGDEAITSYQNATDSGSAFDLVILDLTIPGGLGGYETNKKLLAINPGLLSIVTSGYSEDRLLSDYGKYGFKAFLKKPYKLEDLYSILKHLGFPSVGNAI